MRSVMFFDVHSNDSWSQEEQMYDDDLSPFYGSEWTDKALLELGKDNLGHIINRIKNDTSNACRSAGYYEGVLRQLEGKTLKVLAAEAEAAVRFSDITGTLPFKPKYSHILDTHGVRYGHTTFAQCSGCAHVGSWGSDVRCSFYAALPDQGAPYDSPCRLHKEGELERVRKSLQKQVHVLSAAEVGENMEAHRRLKRFSALQKKAPDLPLLPQFRKKQSFRFGDRVLVWAGVPAFGAAQGKWLHATLLNVRRFATVALDFPMLPKSSMDRGYIPREWTGVVTQCDYRSPAMLTAGEFEVIARLPQGHKLRELLAAEVAKHLLSSPSNGDNGYSEWISADPERYARSLHPSFLMKEAEPWNRLMSGKEALAALGFTTEPASEKAIVTAYRRRRHSSRTPARLEQARSTALVRLYGWQEVGD